MTSWARPGVKCVFLGGGTRYAQFSYPRKGEVCTIRGVFVSKIGNQCITLVGYEHRENMYGQEPGYPSKFFRPLITQSDDVALFKHHLVPVREVEA